MAGLKINAFSGIRPRIPESLLSDREATIARNCDFAYGELRATKSGFRLSTLVNDAMSLYTDDGLTFFSWPSVVNAVRSPIANDTFNRLYYSGDGPLKVTNRISASINGGPPSSSYHVGVPRPTTAPTVTVDIPTIDLEATTLKFTFHYESAGIKYQEQTVVPSSLPAMKYQFTPPAKIASVTEYATIDDFPKTGATGGVYKDTTTGLFYKWSGADYKEVTSVKAYDSKDAFPETGGNADTSIQTGDVFFDRTANQHYLVTVNRADVIFAFYSYEQIDSFSFPNRSAFPAAPQQGIYIDTSTQKKYTGSTGRYEKTTEVSNETPESALPVLRVTGTSKADNTTQFDIYTSNSSFYVNAGFYWVELQKDASAESYTATVNAGIQEEDKETRAYIYTYVNTYNEEGPPSSPTVCQTSTEIGATVAVKKDAFGSYAPLKEIRIYRTPTGSAIADYYFVGSIPAVSGGTDFTFVDDVLAEQLNEPLSSLNYYPPNENLNGLIVLPNGILCAWKDNELHFSEAYKPWAWPPAYVKPLEHAVVSGIAHGSGAIVTTRGKPYAVSGVSPDSMTTTKMNVDQAGVSQRSIAVVDGVCIYASNDGLVTINGATASLIPSQRFFTREVWRQRYSAGLFDMAFGVWDGRLVVFSPSAAFTPFMIRTDEADGTLTDLPEFVAKCAFTNVMSDQMYYVSSSTIYQFNGGSNLTAEWQSRELVLPRPINFGAAQALVEGDWTIELWAYVQAANGNYSYQLKHSQPVDTGLTNFRMPAGFETDRYRIKITGSGRFRELRIAQSFREMSTL